MVAVGMCSTYSPTCLFSYLLNIFILSEPVPKMMYSTLAPSG